MRIATPLLAALSLAGLSSASYFSDGWKPGQPFKKTVGSLAVEDGSADALAIVAGGAEDSTIDGAAAAAGGASAGVLGQKSRSLEEMYTPQERYSAMYPTPDPNLSITDKILEGLNVAVYQGVGIDFKAMYTKAKKTTEYDLAVEDELAGVVRLTDDNYEEEIELEYLTKEEEKDRVWCILVHGKKDEPLTPIFWNAHADAANTTKLLAANGTDSIDMSHVRFARVDYGTETVITTKWLIFKPPYLVFASNRGQELRFLAPRSIRPDGELMRQVLASGEWRQADVWISKWAPGGSYSSLLNYIASFWAAWHNFASKIPRVAWLLVSGVVSQSLLALMHSRSDKKKDVPVKKQLPSVKPLAPAGSDQAKALAEQVRARQAVKSAELEAQQLATIRQEQMPPASTLTPTTAGRKSKGRK